MAKKKEGTTKAEAVRAALAAGVEAPKDGVAYIKEKLGLDITGQQFSTYKSIEKSKGKRGKAAPARRSGRLPVPAPKNGSISEDLTALQGLVKRYGAEEVTRLVSLVGG